MRNPSICVLGAAWAIYAAPAIAADYLVSKSGGRVIVWRDSTALKEGIRLIQGGVAKEKPDLVKPLIACFAANGTRVSTTAGGFFSSTILVTEGASTGCRGDVDNSFLSNNRPDAR